MGRLWRGYGEAMGSYVCITLGYRLAMGWLLGGYGEAMGRPWRGYGKLWGSLKGKPTILRIVNPLSWRVKSMFLWIESVSHPCRFPCRSPCRIRVASVSQSVSHPCRSLFVGNYHSFAIRVVFRVAVRVAPVSHPCRTRVADYGRFQDNDFVLKVVKALS